MPAYSRDELESAFRHFEATARRASELDDWSVWADLFTKDILRGFGAIVATKPN